MNAVLSKFKEYPVGTFFSMQSCLNKLDIEFGWVTGIMIRDNGELCFLAQVTSRQYDVHVAYISPDIVYPIDYDWSRHENV